MGRNLYKTTDYLSFTPKYNTSGKIEIVNAFNKQFSNAAVK